MDNILISIAFTIHSNKGVFALLLGSGVSQSAGIPTGWDVLMDLVGKLITINKESEVNKEKWFFDKYGMPPDYSILLSELVKTQTERVNLLRPYFEPTEKEKMNGFKQPTPAHKEIARLAKRGYFKVILTTNFDRLLEKAFEDEGLIPQVICHEDDIDGATPYIHADCTIVKINGDYIDCRFRNTHGELADYNHKWNEFLIRIFEDFGLITCGWSAKWDKGLVNLICRSINRRYANYFTYLGTCNTEIRELSDFRKGNIVQIENANHFFVELSESINALERFSRNHPLNKDIAIARIKKYIVKPEYKILLHDLFDEEIKKTVTMIQQKATYNFHLDSEIFAEYWEWHLQFLELLIPMCKTTVQWANSDEHHKLLTNTLKTIAYPPVLQSYNSESIKLHYLSSIFLYYIIGISAIKFGKYSIVNKMFNIKVTEKDNDSRSVLLMEYVHPCIFEKRNINQFLSQNYHTPLSTHLRKSLVTSLIDIFESESEYIATFSIFEYLLSLYYLYVHSSSINYGWVPHGEFKWQEKYWGRYEEHPFIDFFKKGDSQRDEWALLKEGKMFDGSYEKYMNTKKLVDEFLAKIYYS